MDKNQSMDSEQSSQITEVTKAKVEALIKAFQQIDRNLDDQLSKDEITDFINCNSKGKQCDPQLLNKLLNELDLDSNGSISVEEFIKEYVDFERNINKTLVNLQMTYSEEQSKYQELQRQAQRAFKEEQANNDMSKNAKITMAITSINLNDIGDLNCGSVAIRLKYKDDAKETCYYSVEKQIFVDRVVEFKPDNRQASLNIELKGKDSTNAIINIGTKDFSLNEIDTQNEYIVDISILNSSDKILAVINSKITFFWSDYLILRDQMAKLEKKLNKLKDNISKTNMYISMMNSPINPFLLNDDQFQQHDPNSDDINYFNSRSKLDFQQHQPAYVDYGINNDNLNQFKSRPKQTPLDKQVKDQGFLPIFTRIEDVIKKTFKQQTIQWKSITKVVSVMMFAFGVLNCIYRPDFPTAAIGLFLLVLMMIEVDINDIKKYIQWIIYGLIGIIVLDIIWIILIFTNSRDAAQKSEIVIEKIALVSSCINIVVKLVLIGVLVMQKNQI